MPTVEDLVVQMRAEGLTETTNELEDAEGEMEQAADGMDDAAGGMTEFVQEWSGAMGAIVTGLAIAAAGLLAQVPVLGSLMEGLMAIVAAVAFQIDKVLRPILQPVADLFFKWSNKIYNADGALGDLIGVIGTIAGALAGLKVLGVVIAKFTALSGLGAVMTAVAGKIAAALTLIAGALGLPVLAVAALIAAVLAVIAIFATDFMGIRSAVVDALTGAWEAIKGFGSDIGNFFVNLAKDAIQWGKDLMKNFGQGILDSLGAPVDNVEKAMDTIKDKISFDQRENDKMAQRWGRDMLTEFGMGMERGIERVNRDVVQVDEGSGQSRRTERMQVLIDGRDVHKETKRYSDKSINRRGRFS